MKERYKSETLEHLGLVAGMFDELGIGELVDKEVPQDLEQRNISVGQALKAMVLNGLGFANRRLYLTTKFFQNKPTERLLGQGVKPEQLNDDALGKALDDLYSHGVSELYSKLAAQAATRLGIKPRVVHMDTTSFHVDGVYNSNEPPDEDSKLIHISQGYSRDHRPELNQVVLELITENQASLPVMMQPLSGNSNDKLSFKQSIDKHIAHLQSDQGLMLVVSDSAGYTQDSIKAYQQQGSHWVMSVPGTLKEAKALLQVADPSNMVELTEGYRYMPVKSDYAGVEQRWLLIYSEQARVRAKKSVAKELLRHSEQDYKAFEKLCRTAFNCAEDAEREVLAFQKTLKVLSLSNIELIPDHHFANAGRPPKDAVPDTISYHLSGVLAADIAQRETLITKRACFILASNNLDQNDLSDANILTEYKGQVHVEGAFRFLKEPMFLASTLYLKKVERIMALLMVMTVCLLVYAALQHRIRKTLQQHHVHLPDQKGKPSQRPTTRWVFELFLDVHLLTIINSTSLHTLVLNLQDELRVLLSLLGPPYQQLYS
ncbi:MAG: IS1634 family transposase [Trueperaceae bacterium]|nr:IS1634 family transposase [Trueperaceae bacterium]